METKMMEHLKKLYQKYGYYQFWHINAPKDKSFSKLLLETQGAINEVFAILVECGFSELARTLNREKLINKGKKMAQKDFDCQYCDIA